MGWIAVVCCLIGFAGLGSGGEFIDSCSFNALKLL
jgi:hypothetical protein